MIVNEKFPAKEIRKTILRMAYHGQTAHAGCALCLVEILAILYRNHLNLDPHNPNDPLRNYLILSKGHGVMALYACLNELGWISDDMINNYFKNGTPLKGLGDAHVTGVEVSGGSLGHGFSVGVGLAYAAKRKGTAQKVFAIVGDGEMNEGPIWEGLLFAAHHKLDNLCLIIDDNKFQAMGLTDEVLKLGSLQKKLSAFGFECEDVDGHDEIALDSCLKKLMSHQNGLPKAIIADTVKGKGVSFMEHDNTWHYKRITEELFEQALKELS
jgi:transketolase